MLGVFQIVGHLIVKEVDDELEHELYGAHFTLELFLLLDRQVELVEHEPLNQFD